jgi:hypothetical protein
VTDTGLASAQGLLRQAMNALAAVVGPGDDTTLVSVLTTCEATARQLDRIVVDAVATMDRRGAFAERGYKSPARALADLLGWEGFEARRRVVAADQVLRGRAWTARCCPRGCPPPPLCWPRVGRRCGTSR